MPLRPFVPKDPNQALRLRRFLIATGTTVLVVLLFGVCYWAGLLSGEVLFEGIAIAVSRTVLFYLLFWLGLNLRFRDPSLTIEQIVFATLNTGYVMYFAEAARPALLPVFVIPFLFGVFRLKIREFLTLGLVVLLVFGAMLTLSAMHGVARVDVTRDLVQFAVVAVVISWFAVFGAYVNGLRAELGASNRKLKAALERIENIAVRDELTGVHNRRYLMETVRQEQARCDRGGAPFTVCLFDIDRFKSVNDSFGHAAGDAVLKHFAATVEGVMRKADIFGRYGGEEFLLVLPATGLPGAMASAERIRADVEASRCTALPPEHLVTVTAGVALSAAGEDVSVLLARADKALYRGKQAGRNRVVQLG